MKRKYIQPTMLVVCLQHQTHLMQASVRSLSSNGNLNYVGSDEDYSGEIRVKEQGNWDDSW